MNHSNACVECHYFLILFLLVQTQRWDQLREAAEVSEELLRFTQCTPLVLEGVSSLCLFRENFLQVCWAKHSQDCSEMQAGAIWAVLSVGYFSIFPPISLSLQAEIIISVAPKWTSLTGALPLTTRQVQNCFQVVPQLGFAGDLLVWVRHGKNIREGGSREEAKGLGLGRMKRWRGGEISNFQQKLRGHSQGGVLWPSRVKAGPSWMWSSTGRVNFSHLWWK